MTAYPFMVFAHVLGAVGIFAAIAIETASVEGLRRAETPADARVWVGLLALPWRLGPIAMIATLASGIWMMAVAWGHQPWIASAFVGLVGMAMAGVVSLRRTGRMRAALTAESPSEFPEAFRSLRSGRTTSASLRLRIALGVGILGLMTLKPGAAGSWLVLAAATAAGLIASIARGSRPAAARRLATGAVITGRELIAISGTPVCVPDARQIVHLQFRRFAGCPVCSLHLRSVVHRHDEILAAGIREVVVFHSTREELQAHAADLPFAVVADPDKRLYAEFGVESAPNALLDPRAWVPILRAILFGIWAIVCKRRPVPALDPHGGRLGLPADFLIASDGRVLACKYGAHAYDQWSVDEILTLAGKGGARS